MFANLLKVLCAYKGTKLYSVGKELGYKTNSAFQKVTNGKDLRLSVLINVCVHLGCKVIITNGKDITIDVTDYYNANKNGETTEENGD